MAKRPGFKNIQIQSKLELFELFEDTYQQSGANSKAEFLGILLEDYLHPESVASSKIGEIEAECNTLSESLKESKTKIEELEAKINIKEERLSHYENDDLKKLLKKHYGKKLSFKNIKGKKMEIVINDLRNVYTAIMNSIQI